MRPFPNPLIEPYRVTIGTFATCYGDPFGMFKVRLPKGPVVKVIISTDYGWDHLSASLSTRCPSWEEMCQLKDLFFEPEECVMQLHPPQSEYVNNHPFCLHLWRPHDVPIPTPPSIMVGVKDLGVLSWA